MSRCRVLLVLAAAVLTASLAACTSAVSGNGRATSAGAASSGAASHDFPSGTGTASSTPSATSSARPSTAARSSAQAARTITVTGTTTQTRYVAHVYASDTITDCAAHAYGAKMIAFLRAHRCQPAHRVLATVDIAGRTAVVSMISTSFTGTGADPYSGVARFRQLEEADGTGSINDLLREGHHIAGVASRIPAHEAFLVVGQDQGVTVFDAWWTNGATPDQAPALLKLEQDLFLTPLASA
jgi:hypothetical protein